MAAVSNQPLKSPHDGILAELNDMLNKRRLISQQSELEGSKIIGKSNKKLNPPIKMHSESEAVLHQHRMSPVLPKAYSEGRVGLSQSMSTTASTMAVVQSHPVITRTSRSLPKSQVQSVFSPPPSRPPPTRPLAKAVSIEQATPTNVRKKKARRLLKKFKKKQTHKVSQTPNNNSEIAVGTTLPVDKGYQNILDFERPNNTSTVSDSPGSKTPKKPMPLPRVNSLSNSSAHHVLAPSSLSYTDQSDSSTPVTSSLPISLEKKRNVLTQQTKGHLVVGRPTRRRTTKREFKHLRKGVCSDGETRDSSDEDGYIMMNPALGPLTLQLPQSTFDPQASGYYLKILPPDSSFSHERRARSEEPLIYEGSEHNLVTSDPDFPPYLTILNSADSPMSPEYVPMGSWLVDNEDTTSLDIPSDWLPTPAQDDNVAHCSIGNPPDEKEEPPIKTNSALLGARIVDGWQQLKYSDVTIHPVEGLPQKPTNSNTFKYQTVDLEEFAPPNEEQYPLSLPERAPTSHPHASTTSHPPSKECIYYKTTSSLMGGSQASHPHTIVAPPLANSSPVRQFVNHNYVEIDTDELISQPTELQLSLQSNQPTKPQLSQSDPLSSSQMSVEPSPYKMAAPTVPERPDDLEGWAQSTVHNRQHLTAGDYSYVKRDNMIPVWMCRGRRRHKTELVTTTAHPGQAPPPSVPPKTASLLREVGLKPYKQITTPEPYLYPVFMKKRAHTQGTPNHRLTLSKVARLKRKGNKSDLPPPVSPYRPKEGESLKHGVALATVSYGSSLPKHNKLTSSHSIPAWVEAESIPPLPDFSPPPIPFRNSTTGPPPVDKAMSTQSQGLVAGLSDDSVNESNLDQAAIAPDSGVTEEYDLGSHMDHQSLAVLCRHGGEIMKRLSQCGDLGSDSESNKSEQGLVPSLVPQETSPLSLDQLVHELQLLLKEEVCSRGELVKAIETQLNIQLSGGNKEEHIDTGDNKEECINTGGNKEENIGTARIKEEHVDTGGNEEQHIEMGSKKEQFIVKSRSTTLICHDSDSESKSSTSTHISTSSHPHKLHTRTHSSPVLLRKSSTNHSRTFSSPIRRIEGHSDSFGYRVNTEEQFFALRGGDRYYSNASDSYLKRANAQKRRTSPYEQGGVVKLFSDGEGVFTHKGGKLTKMGSGVEVEVPPGAVPQGSKQRIWLDILHTTFDPQEDSSDLSDLLSSSGVIPDHMTSHKDRCIQLSPLVTIGPSDAVLNQPIRIKLPHCLSHRNNSWHLQVFGRTHGSPEDNWSEITTTMGLVDLPNKKQKQAFKYSTNQLHLNHVTITTSELGCFKLIGRPIRNGCLSGKQMMGAVFCQQREEDTDPVILEVFITDALTDHVQALHSNLLARGRRCLQRDVPILCFGDGKDMEVLISSQSVPLGTMVIPFGQFWRQKVIGQSYATFHIDPTLLGKSQTLTLKIQQAGTKYIHETNFLMP